MRILFVGKEREKGQKICNIYYIVTRRSGISDRYRFLRFEKKERKIFQISLHSSFLKTRRRDTYYIPVKKDRFFREYREGEARLVKGGGRGLEQEWQDGKAISGESQLRSDLACKGQSYLHNASRELPPREHDISIYTRPSSPPSSSVLFSSPPPLSLFLHLYFLSPGCRRSSPAGLFDSPIIYWNRWARNRPCGIA